ncbi:MAG: hypothetical protein EZS28_029677 [Streblomastix strix]|uniref:Uncharacterized protein n=1 Tax=Streblomastix strix TaxID=222440 RepID=A0A5J4UWX5_9EUKA|nr:MAG: hypothetical protein EZS28_029677 [Streblomastix strix]
MVVFHETKSSSESELMIYEPIDVYTVIEGIHEGSRRYNQQFRGVPLEKWILEQDSKDTQQYVNEVEDPRRGFYMASADQNPQYDINARKNEPSRDIGSRKQPQYQFPSPSSTPSSFSSLLGRKEKDNLDQNKGLDGQDAYTQENKEKQIESKIVQADNAQTNKILYLSGALDWNKPPINAYYAREPYELKDTEYYVNDGGSATLKQTKPVYTKEAKINRPKARKNYIKTSQLIKSIAEQEKLKKYSKKNKKK